jgi:hypothetical protein
VGKAGLFCGLAQGAKELKAAELLRRPANSAQVLKKKQCPHIICVFILQHMPIELLHSPATSAQV